MLVDLLNYTALFCTVLGGSLMILQARTDGKISVTGTYFDIASSLLTAGVMLHHAGLSNSAKASIVLPEIGGVVSGFLILYGVSSSSEST